MKNKPFDYYLQEALKELEKEDGDDGKCEELISKVIEAIIPREIETKTVEDE